MPRSTSNRTLTIWITIAAIMWLVTASQPLAPPVTSNLTRERYEAAVAKWNSLHATEYEQTISMWTESEYWGTWRVVVHIDQTDGNKVESITDLETLDSPSGEAPLTFNKDDESVRGLTVDAIFGSLDQQLQEPLRPLRASDVFYIEFDPTMGYPRHSTYITDNLGISEHIGHARFDVSIWNVKILN